MLAVQVLTLILAVTAQGKNDKGPTTPTTGTMQSTSEETNQTPNQTTSNVTGNSALVSTTVNLSNTSMSYISNNSTDNNTSNIKGPKEIFNDLLTSIQELPGIILFGTGSLMGIILTTVIFCIIKACQSGSKKRSSYPLEEMEMNAQNSPKADRDPIQDQEAADGDVGSAGQLLLNGDGAPKEAEYSDLDFSAAKNRKAPEVGTIPETEYAEIKIENQAQIAEEDVGIIEGNHETLKEDDVMNEEEMLPMPPEEAAVDDELSIQIADET